nr:astra-associated protein 1 [Quercus suber]
MEMVVLAERSIVFDDEIDVGQIKTTRSDICAHENGRAFRELAVLKWHKEGMYATAFADVHVEDSGVLEDEKSTQSTEGVVVKKRPLTVVEQRVAKTQSTHWLAAGSKDGKISLWDIY